MYLWLLVTLTTIFVCLSQADQCITPDGKPGKCQRIQDCRILWDLALKKNINKDQIYFLRKSACGFNATMPMVCCPDKWEVDQCELTAFPPDPRSDCCGMIHKSSEIIDGTLSRVNQYPWMGIIEFQKPIKSKYYNAILISGRYAISVAQCFSRNYMAKYGSPTTVRFGGFNEDAFNIPVVEIIKHPQFIDNKASNDIALIKFTAAAPYTDSIRPICLPTSDFTAIGSNKEKQLTTAGWTSESGNPNPIMKHYQANYMEAFICAAVATKNGRSTRLHQSQVCVIMRDREDCEIHRGGALMYYNNTNFHVELVGIASYAPCSGIPDVYIKVFNYRSWILEKITN